ncbi:AI-2E family transporter [Segetibacter koreensis]|uniref:AI-2E family transporter n=1 Tax=Segetibacter koreensis TaxID=398037 RepID=UPI00035F0DCE|nr:AI-2E family transporter [Segetibacter koreensis]
MEQNETLQAKSEHKYTFPQKVWITGGIFGLIAVLLLFLKATFNVLLLILAGSLIALFFRGLSDLIERKTKWKQGICLSISTLGSVLLIVLLFWLIGAKVQSQIAELSDTLPSTVQNAKEQLNQNPLGQKIVQKISSPKAQKKAQGVIQTFFKTTFGVFGDVYVVIFIGIFFTVAPQLYKNGFVKLIPKKGQPKAENVLNKIGDNLKKWLKGKIFAMFVVFILTAIGLVILGVPMWLVLALIAGILNFIPNFGPLIAMIPAVLVGLMQGPSTAALVAGLYIAVQVAESNFITPMVQKRLINIPPALIIIAQLLISPLTGGWGLVLATPLMVIIMVVVQELYLKRQ